ncbi:hypothetical protein PISL3812_06635 [Talaromyces islandicus]|uniref:Cell wall proline rich protein n=1 Tax=Talaromyces islandicus TaxID=28573 RepID=A0A0U1M1Z2_TALIS|nr:hypothetical protein PISL3812_06635 [Talaromyces islandicus]
MASTATTVQAQESAYSQDPPLGTMDFNMDDMTEPTDSARRRPNPPPFVFPRRPSDADNANDNDYVPPPLPTFSFNPGNLHAPSPSTSAIPIPRPGGHRRRPSELIGGEGPPSPRLLSSSPGKSEMDVTGVPPPPGGPPRGPGRRGHAHRRSQAMSSMDLTAMTKILPPTLTVGSAPTSPADTTHAFQHTLIPPSSRSEATLQHHPTPPESPAERPDEHNTNLTTTIGVPEQRPRPVSLVSNETSSTLSTVRPSHSRVNSATPTATPTKADNKSSQKPKVRPKTADAASLMVPQPIDHMPLPDLPLFRRSSLGNRLSEPYRLSSESIDTSSTKSKGKKKSSKKNKKKLNDRDSKGDAAGNAPLEGAVDMTRDLSSDKWESASSTISREDPARKMRRSAKRDKREQKVRSWAGAIFPIKSKRTQVRKVSRRSPTPPPILTRTNSDMGSIEVDFDTDNTVIIRTPTNPNAPVSMVNPDIELAPEANTTFEAAWKPRSFYEQNVDDTFSPVIDLDAALGPFNTPEMNSGGRVAGSAFSQATKHMYSGGRRGEFIGPEMRYHRRAESAPEMPPIDRSTLGFPRLGSDTTMAHADVFYEEEEDAFLAEHHPLTEDDDESTSDDADNSVSSAAEDEVQPSSSDTLRVPTQEMAAQVPPSDDGLGIHVAKRPVDDSVLEDGPGDAIIEDTRPSITICTSHQEMTSKKSVEVFEADQWLPPRAQFAASPDVSPHTMTFDKRPCSSPHDFSCSLPQLSFPSRKPSSSAFPSPDPSNMSFEGPHSATASSITDQTTFNHLSQYSAEDIPSLSSSASTKTNSRGRFSSSFYARTSAERPMSFSNHNMVPPRSSHSTSAKRASLVSLSRLMSGSYGEKSKLRHEEKPPADESEAFQKKNNRMSRLMFWKTRDKQKSRGDSN